MTLSSEVCVIGCGPRGLSVLERLCANAAERAPGSPLTIHVVDPYPAGAGAVWRRDQNRHLLMNTAASQVSVFTDASVEMAGPLVPGPSLVEWANFLALMDPHGYDDQTLEKARRLGPDMYPTRAFYGEYLDWVLRRLITGAPPQVHIELHRARAVRLDDAPDGSQRLVLDNGEHLTGLRTVVLALGHVGQLPTATERGLAAAAERHGLRYLAPANPADVDLSGIAAGEPVLLRLWNRSAYGDCRQSALPRPGRNPGRGPDHRPRVAAGDARRRDGAGPGAVRAGRGAGVRGPGHHRGGRRGRL